MRKKVLFSLMMLATCTQVSAEGGVAGFLKKLGTSIDSMTIRGLDQRYITMPEKPWQIILKGDVNQCDVVTYNFGDWFFNANAQYNNFVFKHNSNKGSITDWYVNASIGIRL